jgi:hypothetical protein
MAAGVRILKSKQDSKRRQITNVVMMKKIMDSPFYTRVNPHRIRMCHITLKNGSGRVRPEKYSVFGKH